MGTDELLEIVAAEWLDDEQRKPYEEQLLNDLLEACEVKEDGPAGYRRLALYLALNDPPPLTIEKKEKGAPRKWAGEEGLKLYAAVQTLRKRYTVTESSAFERILEQADYFPSLDRPEGQGLKTRYYEVKDGHPLWERIDRFFACVFCDGASNVEARRVLQDQIVEHYTKKYEK